ncbi:hypothetical protein ABAC402_09580 [Asticcacaulis sp. AC402]|nr:hypothetical protein ABAC402_09580 [Asticcacaulis sp. AC402]
MKAVGDAGMGQSYKPENAPARKLAGLSSDFTMTTSSQIPALWERFSTHAQPERLEPDVHNGVGEGEVTI